MIVLENVRKTYQMGDNVVMALRGVSLRIEQGEFVSLIGASGSGKSTLLHAIGLLDRPDGGKLSIAGRDVSLLTDEELSQLALRDDRLRLPAIPSAQAAERVRERRAAAHLRQGRAAVVRPGRPAHARRAGAAHAPQAERAFGRPAAARRHCAGAHPPAGTHPRRRADRQSRFAERQGNHGAAARIACGGADGSARHARAVDRGECRPNHPRARRRDRRGCAQAGSGPAGQARRIAARARAGSIEEIRARSPAAQSQARLAAACGRTSCAPACPRSASSSASRR